MRSRKLAAAYFNRISRDIQAPISIVVNFVACSQKEASDIAAEIQDGTALPSRTFQQLVKVLKLCSPTRDVGCYGSNPTTVECRQRLLKPLTQVARRSQRAIPYWERTGLPRQLTSIDVLHTSTVHGTASGRTPWRLAHLCSAQGGVSTSRYPPNS